MAVLMGLLVGLIWRNPSLPAISLKMSTLLFQTIFITLLFILDWSVLSLSFLQIQIGNTSFSGSFTFLLCRCSFVPLWLINSLTGIVLEKSDTDSRWLIATVWKDFVALVEWRSYWDSDTRKLQKRAVTDCEHGAISHVTSYWDHIIWAESLQLIGHCIFTISR